MALAVIDGPPGGQAVHTFNPSGFALAINDLSIDPSVTARAIIDPARPLQLRSRPPAEDNRQDKTSRMGAVPLPSQFRSTVTTYPLLLQAPSRQLLDRLRTNMMLALADTTALGVMHIVAPGDPLVWSYPCRPMGDSGLDVDETALTIDDLSDSETPYQWTATLSLWRPDPRFFVDAAATLGPFASGTTNTVNNDGYAPADLVITGTRAASTITLENTTYPTGPGHATLQFTGVTETGAVEIHIGEGDRIATIAGADLWHRFDSGTSDWLNRGIHGLLAGNNSIKVTGLSSWSATWNHASL
jgi:hypothetical protein